MRKTKAPGHALQAGNCISCRAAPSTNPRYSLGACLDCGRYGLLRRMLFDMFIAAARSLAQHVAVGYGKLQGFDECRNVAYRKNKLGAHGSYKIGPSTYL